MEVCLGGPGTETSDRFLSTIADPSKILAVRLSYMQEGGGGVEYKVEYLEASFTDIMYLVREIFPVSEREQFPGRVMFRNRRFVRGEGDEGSPLDMPSLPVVLGREISSHIEDLIRKGVRDFSFKYHVYEYEP